MSAESKPEDVTVAQQAAEELLADSKIESGEDSENEETEPSNEPEGAAAAKKKKKRSKRKKIKEAIGGLTKSSDASTSRDDASKAVAGLSKQQISELLSMNPALASEMGMTNGVTDYASERLSRVKLEEIMTGLALNGRNVKDMASYKFWQTQPVPKLDEDVTKIEEGPIKRIDPAQVSKESPPLPDGFEWTTMDLTDEEELKEVYELLSGHYVEDTAAMFRFNYSASFLQWALLAPGWKKDWHVGVRASKSRKLVAFISGVPVILRVRKTALRATEINFLCVHKKLRAQRLTPVLIREITRRSYLAGVFQAIYTAGIVLPKPVSTARYYHRALDWQKLYEVGFSPLPPNSKPSYQVRKYALPDHPAIKGVRPMEKKDVNAVLGLLGRYLAKFDIAPEFTKEELTYWLLHKPMNNSKDGQVIFPFVVEDPSTKKITDFFSFYNLESSIIGGIKHTEIRAAYLFYYASETALKPDASRKAVKDRLNELMYDALILAKKNKFDVFNALTLMENNLFLEQQKFGAGDGQLHYYLYNYNAHPVAGGVDGKNIIDEKGCSGMGMVML